jgi:hypothetical protein
MGVRAVIVDLDGTLTSGPKQLHPGVEEMLAALRADGLRVVIASSRPQAQARVESLGLKVDLVLDRDAIGASKGSALWVRAVEAAYSLSPHEIIWLGDSDQDMRSAVNGSVIYMHAGWSGSEYRYGVLMREPRRLPVIVARCLAKASDWYWTLNTSDGDARKVRVRALMDPECGGTPGLRAGLKEMLKQRDQIPPFGPITTVFFHLLGSIYSSRLHTETDVWTIYPGRAGRLSRVLGPFAEEASRLFRDRYVPDLLVRHAVARDSGLGRYKGEEIDFLNQINTVHLNAEQKQRILGRRILVIDDFCTEGHSFECARNLLLAAGAASVTSVAVVKYGQGYTVSTPTKDLREPYSPQRYEAADFEHERATGRMDATVLDEILESYGSVESLQ